MSRERSENEYLQRREYPPFETGQPTEEADTSEANTSTSGGGESPEEKYFEAQGNQIEVFGSDQSSDSFEYPTDWTDYATSSEEEKMSIKERMSRQNRRTKRAAKAAAKQAEEECLKVEKRVAREKAAEGSCEVESRGTKGIGRKGAPGKGNDGG
ncbi:uncharacterized protein DFL_002948 [Arthrobotrys flagrans]|uniref:Uncharacterized protein n=1 Tax=Arthrobotrys flagrans TaxID=97331 RepID=A0A437ABZ2_ARTFL|nr:hypothetical protein DFL_002948 [Arthrobotrys flagrans]